MATSLLSLPESHHLSPWSYSSWYVNLNWWVEHCQALICCHIYQTSTYGYIGQRHSRASPGPNTEDSIDVSAIWHVFGSQLWQVCMHSCPITNLCFIEISSYYFGTLLELEYTWYLQKLRLAVTPLQSSPVQVDQWLNTVARHCL